MSQRPVTPRERFLTSPIPRVHHEAVGFFLLRTPLLPVEVSREWPELIALWNRLTDQRDVGLKGLSIPGPILEALQLAAPDYTALLCECIDGKRPDDGGRIRGTLLKYLNRMSWRATPYGLFSGTTVGKCGPRTSLRLREIGRYEKHILPDFGLLAFVTEHLGKTALAASDPLLRANDTVYATGDRLRFIEQTVEGGRTLSHKLSAVERTDYVEEVLREARDPRRLSELASLLVGCGAERDEAQTFLIDMVRADVLRVDCVLPIIAHDHFATWLDRIECFAPHAVRDRAIEISRLKSAISTSRIGEGTADAASLINELKALPCAEHAAYLVDPRLTKPAVEANLGTAAIVAIREGLGALAVAASQFSTNGLNVPSDLIQFRDRFEARYGDGAVPLCEALDPETGVGYPGVWESSSGQSGSPSQSVRRWEEGLRRAVWDCTRRNHVEITFDDIVGAEMPESRGVIADSLLVFASIAAREASDIDKGLFRVYIANCSGPSAVGHFGRFCLVHPELAESVRAAISVEESRTNGALMPEVAYRPPLRVANVVARPPLTTYELDIMGGSQLSGEKRILVSDLLVSVEMGRFVLRSERLGKVVVPRHTTAHAVANQRNLPIYRFLGALRNQDQLCGLTWRWGSLEALPFLPRVVHGRAVLALARWSLAAADLRAISAAQRSTAISSFRELRSHLGIPARFAILDGDNELPVNGERDSDIDFFLREASRRTRMTLVEQFPAEGEYCVEGPEGRFRHDFMLPMREPSAKPVHLRYATPPALPVRFAPGSEWLYVKLFAGWLTLDRLIISVIQPLVDKYRTELKQWFFLRYNVPEPHLRLRLRADRTLLWGKVVQELHDMSVRQLNDRSLGRLEMDTYLPEVNRYGGVEGLEVAERFFHLDSEGALEFVEMHGAADQIDRRIQVACSMLGILERLCPDDQQISEAARWATSSETAMTQSDPQQQQQARRARSALYRRERARIEAGFGDSSARCLQSERYVAAISDLRLLAERGLLTRPFASVSEAWLHMHCNRRFASDGREQELLAYDWIMRWCESKIARTRAAAMRQ